MSEEYVMDLINDLKTIEFGKDYIINGNELHQLQIYLENKHKEIERLKEENKYLDELRNANYLSWQDSLSRIEKAINKIQYIRDLGFDYDGFNNICDLKGLIDDLVDLAGQSIKILRGEDK